MTDECQQQTFRAKISSESKLPSHMDLMAKGNDNIHTNYKHIGYQLIKSPNTEQLCASEYQNANSKHFKEFNLHHTKLTVISCGHKRLH